MQGEIEFNIDENLITKSSHTINIEAWDIFNNHNTISYEVIFSAIDNITNVYNFPNPFDIKTFFTFLYSGNDLINIKIDIYSLNGQIIKSIKENSIAGDGTQFYKVPYNGWDGIDDNGKEVPNGTYIYYLEISNQNDIIHKGLHKVTKLK